MDLCCAETDRFLEVSDINKCIHIPIRRTVTVLQILIRVQMGVILLRMTRLLVDNDSSVSAYLQHQTGVFHPSDVSDLFRSY
jgi:hypothetical protein